jgi:hypothetical protein
LRCKAQRASRPHTEATTAILVANRGGRTRHADSYWPSLIIAHAFPPSTRKHRKISYAPATGEDASKGSALTHATVLCSQRCCVIRIANQHVPLRNFWASESCGDPPSTVGSLQVPQLYAADLAFVSERIFAVLGATSRPSCCLYWNTWLTLSGQGINIKIDLHCIHPVVQPLSSTSQFTASLLDVQTSFLLRNLFASRIDGERSAESSVR